MGISSFHPQMLRHACGFKLANEFWESLARSGVTMDNLRPQYAGLAALPRAGAENFGGRTTPAGKAMFQMMGVFAEYRSAALVI